MMADSHRPARLIRRARGRVPRPPARLLRTKVGLGIAALGCSALAACGSAGASTGPVTLDYYQYPDTSAATNTVIANCNAQSHGAYTISFQQLPQAADGQRQQLVRRLAAHDGSIDIMALDVTWEAEFAQAGWILPWTGSNKASVVNGTIGRRCRRRPGRASCTRPPTTPTPSCSGTAPTWCRTRPRPGRR